MGLFEQHPWMLVLMVILISEGWSATKTMLARILRRGISRLEERGYGE
jgi:hypothetical protein